MDKCLGQATGCAALAFLAHGDVERFLENLGLQDLVAEQVNWLPTWLCSAQQPDTGTALTSKPNAVNLPWLANRRERNSWFGVWLRRHAHHHTGSKKLGDDRHILCGRPPASALAGHTRPPCLSCYHSQTRHYSYWSEKRKAVSGRKWDSFKTKVVDNCYACFDVRAKRASTCLQM